MSSIGSGELSRYKARQVENCNQAVASFRHAQEQDKRNREQQARAMQESAQEDQARGQQERFTSLNKQYEAAKKAYGEVAGAARVMTNPRTEIPRVIAERINEVAGLPKPQAGGESTSSAYYSAAHDRINDATINATPRSAGVGAIQDGVSDELKRRNLALVAEMERLDQQLSKFNSAGSSPPSSSATSPGGTLVVRDPDQLRSPVANPWAESGNVQKAAIEAAAATSSSMATTPPLVNPWAENTNPERAVDNPFADKPDAASLQVASAGQAQSGRVLYRLTVGDAAVELPRDKIPDATRGDSIVNGKLACSKDGLGVVIPACEKKRKK